LIQKVHVLIAQSSSNRKSKSRPHSLAAALGLHRFVPLSLLNSRMVGALMAERTSPNELEAAIARGAAAALRKRADALRREAELGTSSAGGKHPDVILKTPEAARALDLAGDFDSIADLLEAGAL
jgi:Tfp pilus assembly protein PilX